MPSGFIRAVASSFGGTAGLFNVAYFRRCDQPPRDFAIGRHYAIVVAGVLMTQVLPFADKTVLGLLDRFERAVYAA